MSLKNWIALLFIYILYLCLGAVVFSVLECPDELAGRRLNQNRMYNTTKAIRRLEESLDPYQRELLDQLMPHIPHSPSNATDNMEDCIKWDFYNSLFFSFTVVTTIGYGHQSTSTNNGRIVCVFYALVGVPLNAILIGALGNVFSNKVNALKKSARTPGIAGLKRIGLVGRVVVEGFFWFLIFTSLFIFLPAALFSYGGLENEKKWDYTDSVYYAVITLTTIGFGDLVAGREVDQLETSQAAKIMYQVGIIVWIIFGLGYIFGVINVISEALQFSSKPVKRAFRGLRNQIQVQDYWRKILNEIITIKQREGEEWVVEDVLLASAAGGSEPCLGTTELQPGSGALKRRVLSTGDLEKFQRDEADRSFTELEARSLQSLDHENTGYLPDIEELNEDTVTSMRQFLSYTRVIEGGGEERGDGGHIKNWVENNVPGIHRSGAPTRENSRKSGLSTVGGGGQKPHLWEDRHTRRRSLQHPARRMGRRHSTSSSRSGHSCKTSVSTGPISLLLEHTTLGEFLTAVENVRARSEAELQSTSPRESREGEVMEGAMLGVRNILRKLSTISPGRPKIETWLQNDTSEEVSSSAKLTRKNNLNAAYGHPTPPYSDADPRLLQIPLFRNTLQPPTPTATPQQSADNLTAEAPLMSGSFRRLGAMQPMSASESSMTCSTPRKQPVRLISKPGLRIDS